VRLEGRVPAILFSYSKRQSRATVLSIAVKSAIYEESSSAVFIFFFSVAAVASLARSPI
jgi:hypothetical protein